MNDPFTALATAHFGLFSCTQAYEFGFSERDIRSASRAGVIRRIRRAHYSTPAILEALDEAGRHILLARAVVGLQLSRVALTGASAAALHGLATYGLDLDTVHLLRLDESTTRRVNGARHQVLVHDVALDLQTKAGLAVVSPARTVWEVASNYPLEPGVCTADSVLRLYPDCETELRRIAATFARRPGSRIARSVVELADGRAETVGESLSRVLFHRHSLPKPELQQRLTDEHGRLVAIADFYWPEHRHVGEFDGQVKYRQLLREGEDPSTAVFREKQREDRVRALELGVTRWIWRDLHGRYGTELVARLAADLERSRHLYRRSA